MPSSVDWVVRLVDRISGPAREAQRRVEMIERAMNRAGQAAQSGTRTWRSWAQAGESSARRVERALTRMQGRVQGTMQGLQGLTQSVAMVGVGVAGAGYGAARVGSAVLGGMGQREGQLTSLGSLLRGQSAAQVKESAAWINNFADVTPFGDREVMDGVKQLLAYKFSFPQVQGIAQITGDAASAMGTDSADAAMKWESINRALGQIKAKGRVQGDELLQLSEAGISPYEYLDKYVGKNWRKLSEQGKLSAGVGISAILKGLQEDFNGSMDKMSKTFSGLWSTLASRPQRILGQMFDDGGLDAPKRMLENLVQLTDFNKNPGKRILTRVSTLGRRIVEGLFGPLADGTAGARGEQAIDRLLDRLDEYADWWERSGPGVIANVRGFGEGLKMAADGATTLLKPLAWLVDKLSGGTGEGGMGKLLGLGAGVAGMAWLGNLLSFGLLGKAGAAGGQVLAGGLKKGLQSVMTRGILGEMLTNPLGRRAGAMTALRGLGGKVMPFLTRAGSFVARLAPLAARALPFLTRIGALFLGLSNPIGWVVTAVTLLGGLGVAAYRHWAPFRDFVDNLGDRFRDAVASAKDIGANLVAGLVGLWDRLPPPARAILSALIPGLGLGMQAARAATQPRTASAGAGASSVQALTSVANNLGIDPQALLAVAFKESSLNPAALNRDSGASGLIQFLPSTARGLGTTAEAIRGMTPAQQAPYIEAYLKQAGVTAGMGLEQVYAAVFAGHASKTGRVLYTTADGRAYSDNRGLDLDGNGEITSSEAANAAAQAWQANAASFAPNVTVNLYGPATPQAVQDIGRASGLAVGDALGTYALEHGAGGAR